MTGTTGASTGAATHAKVAPSAPRSAQALIDTLQRARVRVTTPRQVVASLVAARSGHFTAAELVADAQRTHPGIGRATVFRALDLFSTLRLVERVDLPGGDHAYVACESAHHHHAICTGCGLSFDIEDVGLADVLAAIGRRSGFEVTAHRLEVFGRCSACRAGVGRA